MLALLFSSTSIQYGLPSELLSSLCFVESSHRVEAIHPDDGGTDSLGICQVKLSTARWLGFEGSKKQLMDPATNIHYAGKYLSYLIDRYDGNVERAVIGYNMGHAGNYEHTNYSTKVLNNWKARNQ